MFKLTQKKRIIFKVVVIIMSIILLHVIVRVILLNKIDIHSNDFLSVVATETIFSYTSVLLLSYIVYLFLKKDFNKIQAQIASFAFTDGLTGLYNRHHLNAVLQESSGSTKEKDSKVAVAFLDIDDFKVINDTHGHSDGDCILKCLSKVLKKISRKDDTVFRYGGEEFIIIFSNMTYADALEKVKQIVTTIEDMEFECISKKVTVSIGLSHASGEHELSKLLNNADSALYMAKNDGKNCVKVFS